MTNPIGPTGPVPPSTKAEKLAEPFDPAMLRSLDKNGTTLTYVPGSEVIARLNRVLGLGRWSWTINDRWTSGEEEGYPKWCMVEGTLAYRIDDGNGPVEAASISAIGGQAVKFTRSGAGPVDMGDEWKGAATDALKKAAQHLGVGLDLARRAEAMEAEEFETYGPADQRLLTRMSAAIASLPDQGERNRIKREFKARYGEPSRLTANAADDAAEWVEIATGVAILDIDDTSDPFVDRPQSVPADSGAQPADEGPAAPEEDVQGLLATVSLLDDETRSAFTEWWGKIADDPDPTAAQVALAVEWLEEHTEAA